MKLSYITIEDIQYVSKIKFISANSKCFLQDKSKFILQQDIQRIGKFKFVFQQDIQCISKFKFVFQQYINDVSKIKVCYAAFMSRQRDINQLAEGVALNITMFSTDAPNVYNKIKLKFTNVLNVTTQDKIKFVSYKIFSA